MSTTFGKRVTKLSATLVVTKKQHIVIEKV
jgi:hypothetical protein